MTNGTPENLYIPSDVHLGGQRTSASQLEVFTRCYQEGFLSYMAPHPEVSGGNGLRSRLVAIGLTVGGIVHNGLHQYFLSGWRDGEDSGERDVMKAMDYARQTLSERRDQLEKPEEYEKAERHVNRCLEKFCEMMETGSLSPKRVVADSNGDPVLEREFQIPLADGRFVYIDKIDAMFSDTEGYHQVGEYKTSMASYASDANLGIGLMGQNVGHMGVLFHCWPSAPINGVLHYTLVKDRGGKSDLPHVYEIPVLIDSTIVETYMHGVEDILEGITDRAIRWENQVSEGWDPYQAALTHFPQTGMMNRQCKRFRRMCQFAGYCEAHGFGSRMLQGFKPRTVEGKPFEEDNGLTVSEGEVF